LSTSCHYNVNETAFVFCLGDL